MNDVFERADGKKLPHERVKNPLKPLVYMAEAEMMPNDTSGDEVRRAAFNAILDHLSSVRNESPRSRLKKIKAKKR